MIDANLIEQSREPILETTKRVVEYDDSMARPWSPEAA